MQKLKVSNANTHDRLGIMNIFEIHFLAPISLGFSINKCFALKFPATNAQ